MYVDMYVSMYVHIHTHKYVLNIGHLQLCTNICKYVFVSQYTY